MNKIHSILLLTLIFLNNSGCKTQSGAKDLEPIPQRSQQTYKQISKSERPEQSLKGEAQEESGELLLQSEFYQVDYLEIRRCQNCPSMLVDPNQKAIELGAAEDSFYARTCRRQQNKNETGIICGQWTTINPSDSENSLNLAEEDAQKINGIPSFSDISAKLKTFVPFDLDAAEAAAIAGVSSTTVAGAIIAVYFKKKLNSREYFDYIITKGGQSYKIRFQVPNWPQISPGLVLDHQMMVDAFQERGFKVEKAKFPRNEVVNLNLHMEKPGNTSNAAQNWMLVNQEFFQPSNSKKMDKFLCRHADCTDIVKSLMGKSAKVETIKFSSKVNRQLTDLDYTKFFHPAGKSPMKNTNSLIKAWLSDPTLPPLVVTCYNVVKVWGCLHDLKQSGLYDQAMKADNIIIYTERLSDEEFSKVSKIGNIVMPSMVEGYGHSINEARGKGQIVLTMDADPMGSFVEDGVSGYKVKSTKVGEFSTGAAKYGFDESELLDKVRMISNLSPSARTTMGDEARKAFLSDREMFRTQFVGDAEIFLRDSDRMVRELQPTNWFRKIGRAIW